VQTTKIIVSFHPTIEKNFPGFAYEIAKILGRFAPQINMKLYTHPLPPSPFYMHSMFLALQTRASLLVVFVSFSKLHSAKPCYYAYI
jgi:hypothetical protein